MNTHQNTKFCRMGNFTKYSHSKAMAVFYKLVKLEVIDIESLFEVIDIESLFEVIDIEPLFEVIDIEPLFEVIDIESLFEVIDIEPFKQKQFYKLVKLVKNGVLMSIHIYAKVSYNKIFFNIIPHKII
jgi:hypothetical protein